MGGEDGKRLMEDERRADGSDWICKNRGRLMGDENWADGIGHGTGKRTGEDGGSVVSVTRTGEDISGGQNARFYEGEYDGYARWWGGCGRIRHVEGG